MSDAKPILWRQTITFAIGVNAFGMAYIAAHGAIRTIMGEPQRTGWDGMWSASVTAFLFFGIWLLVKTCGRTSRPPAPLADGREGG